MKIFTIGFTQKSAESFFEKIKQCGVVRVVDVRLNNTSQLAGFAKQDDLRYFLHAIASIDYIHEPLLTPTDDLLKDYKKGIIKWPEYESRFLKIIQERQIEKHLNKEIMHLACLLCSETKPDHCHRRLVAEYLSSKWGDVGIHHIV